MTWLDLADDDPFGIHNLPYCMFQQDCFAFPGVRIGDRILNLHFAEAQELIDAEGSFQAASDLNGLLSRGPQVWHRVREQLIELLTGPARRDKVEESLVPVTEVALQRPFEVADYVDFYSSEDRATNLGKILRPGSPSLPPNWKHLPIGYHGRAGTVLNPDAEIVRPRGQRKTPDMDAPEFGPSQKLDIEAEVGFVVGVQSVHPLSPDAFREHVFGAVLVNDWSARDIQAWEYQPLGPFLGKSFATSVSPYLVPLEALEAAKIPAPVQDPPVLPYLREAERFTYDIRLEVSWNGTVVSRPPFAGMYWTPAQQFAHMISNGAETRTGDLFASGTVSGPARDQAGSFIELTWNGAEPVRLADGSERAFLLDGDRVVIAGWAPGPDGKRIGFGSVDGTVTGGH